MKENTPSALPLTLLIPHADFKLPIPVFNSPTSVTLPLAISKTPILPNSHTTKTFSPNTSTLAILPKLALPLAIFTLLAVFARL